MSTTCAATLDRLLDPISRDLSADAARQILELRIEPDLQARLDHLAELAGEGRLDEEQLNEYRLLVNALDLISVLQAKARKAAVSTGS